MALTSSRRDYVDVGLGCYGVNANYYVESYLDAVSWGRDPNNAARSKLSFTANALMHYDTLVWAGGGNFTNNTIWCWSNIENKSISRDFPKGGTYSTHCRGQGGPGCYYILCNGADWYWSVYHGHWNDTMLGDVNTTMIGISCQYIGMSSGDAYYNLPDNLRVLPPVGLSVSWPTSIMGSVSASITKWAENTNIGGTPTSYTGASYWNWAIDLLDENGNMVAHKTFNTGETKSCSFGVANSGWYTASALNGSASALGSPYTLQAGKKYKLRVYAQNNMNQRLTADSGWYVSSPPKPTVSITSIVYDPATKKNKLCFNWSLGQSSLTPETVTYKITLPDGTSVSSGTLKTISDGAATSDSKCVTGLPTGDLLKVEVKNTAGPSGNQMSETGSDTMYAPVANAAFLGFDWDELRRTCTIRAEAPGAANCRIEAGYAANNYNIDNKLTSGEISTLVVKDLNHGSGQIMYLQATPEASDGHKFTNEVSKISVPIPNPILGIKTPSCEEIELGAEKEYIVDIIEKKKGSTTCTPRWQNGDRVVYKLPCGTGVNPWRLKPVAATDTYGNSITSPLSLFLAGATVTYRVISLDPSVPARLASTMSNPIVREENAYVKVEWLDEIHVKLTSLTNTSSFASPTASARPNAANYGNVFMVRVVPGSSGRIWQFCWQTPLTSLGGVSTIQPDNDDWSWK